MTPRRHAHSQRGFTLMEAVIVIVLTGIVAVMVTTFMRAPITAYVDQSRRAELTDAADGALRRIARELRTALPNSVRVDPTGAYLEYLPVRSAGRYRVAPTATGTPVTDPLDFGNASDNSFDVLGPAVTALAGDQLVVHNLGLPGADAYEGSNRRPLTTFGNALANLGFDAGAGPFPYASPSSRFQVIGSPVSFGCAPGAGGTGSLRRYAGYAIQAGQPNAPGAAPLSGLTGANNALVTPSVSSCSFAYAPGASVRNAVVTLRLTLTSGGESITLLQQVQVENSP